MRLSITIKLAGVVGCLMLFGCSGTTPGSGGISAEEVEKLAEESSEYQKEVLRDGKVTYAEYERAVSAERDCLIDEGFNTTEIEFERGLLSYNTNIQNEDPDVMEELDKRFTAVQKQCNTEYVSTVEWVWSQQQVLSSTEREDMKPKLYQCLRDAGLEVKDDASDDELATALAQANRDDQEKSDAVLACADQYYEYFIWAP